MEEKIMNLLEQLYIEAKGIKREMGTTNKRLNNFEKNQETMQNDIKDLKEGQERIESKIEKMDG